jgi:hypothetical protein
MDAFDDEPWVSDRRIVVRRLFAANPVTVAVELWTIAGIAGADWRSACSSCGAAVGECPSASAAGQESERTLRSSASARRWSAVAVIAGSAFPVIVAPPRV